MPDHNRRDSEYASARAIACFVPGMAVAGWMRALAAELFGGLTRPDLEGVLTSEPRLRPIDLCNRACLDLPFGRRQARE